MEEDGRGSVSADDGMGFRADSLGWVDGEALFLRTRHLVERDECKETVQSSTAVIWWPEKLVWGLWGRRSLT